MATVGTRPQGAADALDTLVRVAGSPIHGLGCFARVPIAQGVHIGRFEGPEVGEDGPYVLWLCDPDGAVVSAREGANALRWLNHSEDPNAELDAFELYAVRAIGAGEEITIDYRGETGTG
jgi:uncharacterized protein